MLGRISVRLEWARGPWGVPLAEGQLRPVCPAPEQLGPCALTSREGLLPPPPPQDGSLPQAPFLPAPPSEVTLPRPVPQLGWA